MDAGAHTGFILAAYLLTAVVLAGMIVWIVVDARMQKRRLAELEAQGIRRRSTGRSE